MSRLSTNVINYRKKLKSALVYAFGSKCCCCQHSFEDELYDFHHKNPKEKSFAIGNARTSHTKQEILDEAKKCCMVCANCHRRIEYGYININDIKPIDIDENMFWEFYEKFNKKSKNKNVGKAKVSESKKLPREALKFCIRNFSFIHIGNMCGVSDNAVKKWCKTYGLPHTKKEIDAISDEDWKSI